MTIHDDYWWSIQDTLNYAETYVYFAKKANENMRNGYIVPHAHKAAAEWGERLEEAVEKLSTQDWLIIHDLIEEMMS